MKKNIGLLASICLLVSAGSAQDSSGVRALGRIWYSNSTDVAILGDYALVADNDAGLRILNIEDERNPVETGVYPAFAGAMNIVLVNSACYIACSENGLKIVDVSDPLSPELLGSFNSEGTIQDVKISGGLAFLAEWRMDGRGGLRVVDVSNPRNPEQIGYCETGTAQVAYVEGNCVLIAGGGWLKLLDVRDPFRPRIISSIVVEHPQDIIVKDLLAYIPTLGSGLIIVDISRIETPRVVYNENIMIWEMGISVRDTLAFVAAYDDGIRIFDLSQPDHPNLIGSFDTPEGAYDITLRDNIAFIANSINGVRVVDVSNPDNPEEIGYWAQTGYPHALNLNGDYACLIGRFGLEIIDIQNPREPQIIGRINDLPCNGRGMAFFNRYLYTRLDYHDGMAVFDISNPANPELAAVMDTLNDMQDIVIDGEIAYVASSSSGNLQGLSVLSLADPASPLLIGNDTTIQSSYGIDIEEDFVFLTGYNDSLGEFGLYIVNISNPTEPQQVGFLPAGYNDVKVRGDHAFVVGDGLYIIDITDKSDPALISRTGPSSGFSIDLTGDFAVIADDQNGIRIYNIRDPAAPYEVGYYDGGGQIWSVQARDNLVYVVGLPQEFGIYDCSGALATSEHSVNQIPSYFSLYSYPNPFNSSTNITYTLPKAGWTVVDVMDIQGRLVERLSGGWKAAGRYREVWGASLTGQGMYFARLSTIDNHAEIPILLVK
jgi:hypothetical protein